MELPFDFRLLAVLVVLFMFVTVAKTVVNSKKAKGVASYPYVSAQSLFTKNEQMFLRVLEQAAGSYRVFGKVRVTDLIEVRKGLSKSEWQGAFNRISQKHVDFVLCCPHDLSVWCAIELDDATHGRADRQQRDALLEEVFAAAKVPLMRVQSQRTYDVTEIRALLDTQKVLAA